MGSDKKIIYLTVDEIIEFNVLVLKLVKTKKADKSEILSYTKIKDIVDGCMRLNGDIYEKATFLFKNTIKSHAFASGNRRTAFIITKHFLTLNIEKFNIKDEPGSAKIMTGIRDNYYTDNEIENWIKNGQIREFKRF